MENKNMTKGKSNNKSHVLERRRKKDVNMLAGN
jgi:hypothetical protein